LKRALQLSAIVALTVFLIWLFLKNANLREVWSILRATNLAWLTVAVVVNLTTLFFRTVRWRTLLDPDDPPPFYATFFANTVGYMLSAVLPIRAADVARPALLSRRTHHRFSGALGSVLTERILDLASILLLFITFAIRRWAAYTGNPATRELWFYMIQPATIVCCSILAALAFFVIGIRFFSSTIRRMHAAVAVVIPRRFRPAWMNFFDAFVQSLEISRHRGAFAKVLFCTAGVWFCLTTQFAFTILAMHRWLPFDASFFVTGATTVGLAVPTPGGIGGVHKVAQFVLTRFYGFDNDSAVAAAVLFHLVGTLPVIVLGLSLFIAEGLRWKDVTRA
jgi:uncharacterized protein (TIRG00374 family)